MKLFSLLLVFICTKVVYGQAVDSIRIQDIENIKIFNGTYNRQIVDSIKITDPSEIKKVIHELNALKSYNDTPNLRASLGAFDIKLRLKNQSLQTFSVLYTTYDGVIIVGSDGVYMDKYYKNDQLEMLVLLLFIGQTK